MPKVNIAQIVKKYYPKLIEGQKQISVFAIEQGFMNNVYKICIGDKSYIAIFYNKNRYNNSYAKNFLEEINNICLFLKSNSIPCRVTNNQIVQVDGRFLGIYDFIEGKTLSWEAYTRRHLTSLSETMNKMHTVLQDYKGTRYIPSWNDYLPIDYKKLHKYYTENLPTIETKLGIKIEIEKIESLYKNIINRPVSNKQLVHMDFVRGNILFDNNYKITGILDFEKMLIGDTQLDRARTYAFLVVDCKYKTKEQIDYYFGKGDKNLVEYFWLRDFWKFLSCNPYESLSQNEHYQGTLLQLKKTQYII